MSFLERFRKKDTEPPVSEIVEATMQRLTTDPELAAYASKGRG